MTEPTPIVHIVDDDDSVRTAVMRLLRAAGYEVRGYTCAGEFLLANPGPSTGCVVLDVRMPGPSGLEFQSAYGQQRDALPIIFLTGHGDIPMSVRAMKGGAVDFLTKPVRREALLAAVQTALARNAETQSSQDRARSFRKRYEHLTQREKAVLALVAAGKLNKQIASELKISERTVKAHRGKVMQKMQVASLAELVRLAAEFPLCMQAMTSAPHENAR